MDIQGNRPPSNHMMNMNPIQQKIIPSGSMPNVSHQFQRQQYMSVPMEQHQMRQTQPQHMTNPPKMPQQGQRHTMYPPNSGEGSSTSDYLKRKLDKYILEYLKKSNYNSSASTFEQESSTGSNISSPDDVNELGFLFDMWCNFWDIYGDFQVRRTNFDSRQYRNDMKGYYYPSSVHIRQPSGNSNGHMMAPTTNPTMRTNGFPSSTLRSSVSKGPPPHPAPSSSYNMPHGSNVYMAETKHDQFNRAPMQMSQLMGQEQGQHPPQKFLPQQNPLPPHNRSMMMNPPTPQGGYQPHTSQQPQQQQQRYYPNQMMNSPSLSNPPTPSNESMNIQSPGNIYSPMTSQSSLPPKTSPQELTQTRRTKAKETKAKTAKITSKKTRSKVTKDTKSQKSRTANQQTSPVQESSYPQQQQQGYQQGNYMDPIYSPYPPNQHEYMGENYNNPSPYGPQGDMDDLTIENQQPSLKKHKASEMMDSTTGQNNGIKNSTPDTSYLKEVNDRDIESQAFIMNSLENSSDILANFENESKSPLTEFITLETPPEDNVNYKLIGSSFNTTGELIASGTSKSFIFVWDIENKKVKYRLNSAHNTTDVRFSPIKSTYLISSSIGGLIELWDCRDEVLLNNGYKSIKTFNPKTNGPMHSVDFHPTRENIFCSSDSSGNLRIWDINQEDCIITINEAATRQARFSPSGHKIATSVGATIKIYDANTHKLINEISDHSKHIQCIYWGENDDTLISASEDCVKVWKLNGNQLECISSFTGNKNYSAIPHPLYMDTHAIIGSYQYLYVWDFSQNRQMNHHTEIHAHNGIISSLCSFGKIRLASTSHDSCVKIWDFET